MDNYGTKLIKLFKTQTLILSMIFAVLIIFGCKPKIDEKKVEQIVGDGKDYQDIIKNPYTADGLQDTLNMPKLHFSETFFDFGMITEGTTVTHEFEFSNTGKKSLKIQDAQSSCGCTVPKFPKEPIAPGQKSTIEVKFNSDHKNGNQNKTVTILSNAFPSKNVILIKGTVVPKK